MDIKFNCTNPQCQQRLSVAAVMAGGTLACPACGTPLQVPASPHIKFNCPDEACGQPMVVDAGEAGRFVHCPACGKTARVPGTPAKAMVAARPVEIASAQPAGAPAPKHGLRAGLRPFRRLLWGWGLGAAICGLVMGGWQLRFRAALPPHLDALLDETYFHGEILSAPVENHAGTALAYVRTIAPGAGVFLVNLATLEHRQIALGKIAAKNRGGSVILLGWSPDDGYLAFATSTNGNACQHLVICDGQTGGIISAFELPQPVQMGSWRTPDSLVLLSNTRNGRLLSVVNLPGNREPGSLNAPGLVDIRKLDRTANWLTPDSATSVAYVEKGNVWSLDLAANRAFQLTQLTNATLTGLDYSPVSQKYLFEVEDEVSKQRRPYAFGTRTGNPAPLNDPDYAFKGQWLSDGAGIAYVGAVGHGNYLAIRAAREYGDTNLFTFPQLDPQSGLLSGHATPEGRQVVRSYGLSPKRDKLYAVASLSYEPLGIWEYDLAGHHLRPVVPVKEPLVYSRFIAPVPGALTNSAGRKIDYFYLPPAGLVPGRKYPVLLDQYSDLGFKPISQFIANAGIFFVTINAYGVAVPKVPPNPEDTLAVYRQMLGNPNVDPRRIYLSGERDGFTAMNSLLADQPGLWRGEILMSPAGLQAVSADQPMVPSILMSLGIKDTTVAPGRIERFALTACAHRSLVQMFYGDEGHVFYGVEDIKQRYKEVAMFILENR